MKRLFVISVLAILTFVQAKAYDFYAVNNDGVKIYYDIQAGSGNRVMVTNSKGAFPTYSGVVKIPNQVTYERVQYVVEAIGSGAFYRCEDLTDVILPQKLKTIREEAFSQCVKLTSIIIPDEVISIRYNAFSNCNALKTVSLGANLTEIGEFAFYQCTDLENITFGNKVSLIDYSAFSACYNLKNIQLPESITEIGAYAFAYSGLTSITIPNKVLSIGSGAFDYCAYLEQAIIGDNVSSIGNFAFAGCFELKKFIVSEQNQKYSTEDGVLVSKDKTVLIEYTGGKSTSDIPASIKTIGEGALSNRGFSKIIIPDNVTTIGAKAFYHCRELTELVIGRNVQEIGSEAFLYSGTYGHGLDVYNLNPIPQVVVGNTDLGLGYNDGISKKVSVPVGSGDLYKKANYWRDLGTIEQEYIVANENIINEDITIFNAIDGITVNSSSPTIVNVYSISGQVVYQKYMRDRLDIQLQRGLYIVKVGNVTKKLYVR